MALREQQARTGWIAVATALAGLLCAPLAARAAITNTYRYDSAGRLTNISYGARSIAYAYDTGGNLLERRAVGGPPPQADLSVVMQGDPATLEAGRGNLVYALAVSNAGPAAAANIRVADPLPPGTVFATASAGAESGGFFTANLGSLAAGAQTMLRLEVVPLATGTFLNAASVTNDVEDPQPANNLSRFTNQVVRAADTNANGLADWWEIYYLTNPADRVAGGDFDHDGAPNDTEQNAGTDPTLDTSLPQLALDSLPVPLVLGFEAASGRVYHVDWSSNLPAGLWQGLHSNIPGHGVKATATDTNVDALRFYRLRIQYP